MARLRRLPALPALSAIVLALGCAGPPIAAPIEGIVVCPDFMSGSTKMEGSLRFPVRLTVKDSGKNVLYRTILSGQRTADAPKPSSYIADDNQKYTVEWEQCGNPRAPRSVAELSRSPKAREKAQANEVEGTSYDCGEATMYKPDGVLETKKHDRASHVITFVAPPNPACWTGETAPAAGGAPSAADAGAAAPAAGDAGAAEPAAAATDAGALSDAGAAPAAATSASAGPAAAGDAGAVKAKP